MKSSESIRCTLLPISVYSLPSFGSVVASASAEAWGMTMFRKLTLGLSAALLLIGFGAPANASLIGTTVNYQGLGTLFSNQSGSVVVGDGVEFVMSSDGGNAQWDIDIDASGLTVTARFSGGVIGTNFGTNINGTLLRGLQLDFVGLASGPLGGLIDIAFSGTATDIGDDDFILSSEQLVMAPETGTRFT